MIVELKKVPYDANLLSFADNPSPRLAKNQKAILVDILKGIEIPTQHYENDNIMELVGLGYIEVNEYGDAYELTPSGKEIVETEFDVMSDN